MYAMPGFNQVQQKLELIFLRFFIYVTRPSIRDGEYRIDQGPGTRGAMQKSQTDRTKRSGTNAGSHCLSQITANIGNPAARDTTTKIHVDIRETRRDETRWNETRRIARRGTTGKSEESPEEWVSADRYITGKARPR